MKNKIGILILFLCLYTLTANAQGGTWTWMGGPDSNASLGNYGTKGVPDVNNIPPHRYQAVEWTDLDGNFWMFGGLSAYPTEFYSDLWRFNPQTNEWTWIHGPQQAINDPGNLGVQGVPSPLNIPKSRSLGTPSWTGTDGNLYLYGGSGQGSSTDLWRYNITSNEWTWLGSGMSLAPNYGIQNVPAASNHPGLTAEAESRWVTDDKLWMLQRTNALWSYDLVSGLWTWERGNAPESYGTKGVEDASNEISNRWAYAQYMDGDDNLWICGGGDVTNMINMRGDTWRFNTNNNQWTWMNGPQNINQPGNSLGPCIEDNTAYPASRYENSGAQTSSECALAFWMFGGKDLNDQFNDLWLYNTITNSWIEISPNGPFNFGVQGVPDPSNKPMTREGSSMWVDNNENVWVYGGTAIIPGVGLIELSDMWRFTPDTTCFNIIQTNSSTYIWPDDTTICAGDSVRYIFPDEVDLTVIPANLYTFNSATNELVLFPNTATSYNISIQSKAFVACPYSDTHVLQIDVLEPPIANFSISPLESDQKEFVIQTTNISSNASKYEWYYNGQFISNDKDIAYQINEYGEHCFQLIVSNDCGIDSMTICATSRGSVYIPNAFSPNGDGNNDIFKIAGEGISGLNYIAIYNRFGQRVFYQEDNSGWDGSFLGEVCEIGTYFYMIEIQQSSGNKLYTGDISLLR